MRSIVSLIFPILIGLSVLTLQPAPSLHAADAPGPACPQGKAKGLWDLPAPGQPGHVVGILIDQNGDPMFHLGGQLAFVPSPGLPGMHGTFTGKLELLAPPGQPHPLVSLAHGHWIAGPNGQGVFEIVLLKPEPGPGVPQPIGKIRGKFLDPVGTGGSNSPGHFQGKWKICGRTGATNERGADGPLGPSAPPPIRPASLGALTPRR